MAHELSIRKDGKAEMAFVGETPWHGLGQNVTKGASIGVWAKEAGLDWTADASPVYFNIPNRAPALKADGYKMLYRSDNHEQLSIVGSDYNVVQPGDVLEFFRDLTEQNGWWIHTAGVLRGGRKLWAMATNGDEGNVVKGDTIKRNLLLATSLDGSMRTIAQETQVRVVCANTLAMAIGRDGAGRAGAIATSHRSVFDPEAVKRALGVKQDHFKTFMAKAQELANTPVKLDEAREFLRVIFRVNAPAKVAAKPKLAWLAGLTAPEPESPDTRSVLRVLELFQGQGMGADLKGVKGTRWGLLNAVSEHVDHEMGRTDDTRLDAAWFGRGASIKKDAMEALMVE